MARIAAWEPALNELNYALGEYLGVFESVYDRNDGGQFEVTNAYFSVLGADGENRQIPVRISEKYHGQNSLGLLGKGLGFEYKVVYEVNSEGFKILKSCNLEELDQVLVDMIGVKFYFKMNRTNRGLWEIDLKSMKKWDRIKK